MIHATYTDPTTPLGHLIRARREVLGLSQGKLAPMVGMDVSMISRLEAGSRDLHPSNIPAFAAALDVSEVTLAMAVCRLTLDDLRAAIRAEMIDEVLASVRDAVAGMQPASPLCGMGAPPRDETRENMSDTAPVCAREPYGHSVQEAA